MLHNKAEEIDLESVKNKRKYGILDFILELNDFTDKLHFLYTL